jgi:hypothetical protein
MQDAADTAAREVLNDRQAAAFLGVSPGTLANWRSSGTVRLPFVKLGRAVRYRVRDLQAFLSKNTVGAAGEQGE